MEQPATFYDAVYRRYAPDAGWIQGVKSRTLPAMNYAFGSVLDIGCGLGLCADMTDGEYHGLDFSEFAIQYAREHTSNDRATFEVADFLTWNNGKRYDTVLLLEVLEHVEDYKELANIAKKLARKRVIITVPANMPYPAHVKHEWNFEELAAMFGSLSTKAIIGGKWLLAVYDVVPTSVSLCMIVRDEEDLLPIALDSVRGLADEIVICDTGSTDRTVEIAKSYGCRVVTGGDRMHKGKSRNRTLDKATGEWIVTLDADEQIQEPERLRDFLYQTEALVVYTRTAYMNGDGQPFMSFQRIGAWRNGALRWRYRCHEIPLPADDKPKLAIMTDFLWEHRPPPERETWKLQYSYDRLVLDVQENPGDPRPVYYLGRQLMYMERYQEAIATLQRYIKMGGRYDIGEAWFHIARSYKEMGQETVSGRMAALHQACAVAPHRREFWGMLADAYWKNGQHELARDLMKAALNVSQPETTNVQHNWFGDAPHDVLANWERVIADGIRDAGGPPASPERN